MVGMQQSLHELQSKVQPRFWRNDHKDHDHVVVVRRNHHFEILQALFIEGNGPDVASVRFVNV